MVNIRWTSYGKLTRLDCDYVVRLGSGKSEVYMTKKRNLVSRRSMNYIILYKFKYAVTRSLKPQWVGEKGFLILKKVFYYQEITSENLDVFGMTGSINGKKHIAAAHPKICQVFYW